MKDSKFFEKLLNLFLKCKNQSYKCRNGFGEYISYLLTNIDYENDLKVYPTKDGEILFNNLKEMLAQKIKLTEENLLNRLNPKKKTLEQYQKEFSKIENAVLQGEKPLKNITELLDSFGKDHPGKKLFAKESN